MAMQMDPMMLLMMSQMGGDSSSSKDGGMDMGKLMQLMMGAQDETIEALYADGSLGGTTTDRSGAATVGVLEIMVIPPTAADPQPRLRWKTNGPIIGTPAQILKVAERFIDLCNDPVLLSTFEDAKELIPEAEEAAEKAKSSKMMAGMLGS